MGVDNCEEGGAGVHRGQCTRTRGGRAKVSPVASTSQTPAPRGKVLLETQTGECTCCRLQPPHQTPTSGLSFTASWCLDNSFCRLALILQKIYI